MADFDSLVAVRDLEEVGVVRAQAEAIVRVARSIGGAGRGEPATKSCFADLETRFARLEAKTEEFRADFSAAMNKVIFSQIVVSSALFAALKLF